MFQDLGFCKGWAFRIKGPVKGFGFLGHRVYTPQFSG